MVDKEPKTGSTRTTASTKIETDNIMVEENTVKTENIPAETQTGSATD